MRSRPYRQTRRAESAAQTRLGILQALYRLLQQSPTDPGSIAQIAQAAGVSRSAIYAIFESRAGLFEQFGHYLFQRAGWAELVAAVARPDAVDHLNAAVTAWVDVLSREREIFAVMFAPGGGDTDALSPTRDRVDAARKDGLQKLTQQLHDQGHLRPDVPLAMAEDVLWLLTSFAAFDTLFTERGLPAARVSEVMLAIAHHTLLRSPDQS